MYKNMFGDQVISYNSFQAVMICNITLERYHGVLQPYELFILQNLNIEICRRQLLEKAFLVCSTVLELS